MRRTFIFYTKNESIRNPLAFHPFILFNKYGRNEHSFWMDEMYIREFICALTDDRTFHSEGL